MKMPTTAQTTQLINRTRTQAEFMDDLGAPQGALALAYLERLTTEAAGDAANYVAVRIIHALAAAETAARAIED